jgi:inosose dehydratase
MERAAWPAVRVANAPVSYGVFELTAGKDGNGGGFRLPDPDELLGDVRGAGYAGVDLGPLGYFGEVAAAAERLRAHGLLLSGGWVQLRLSEPTCWDEDLALLDRALDTFAAAARDAQDPWKPKPTLADAGSAARRANPGGGRSQPEIGLDAGGWRRLAEGVQRAAERCRARGLEPTFHHHASTHVESPHEIERFLEVTEGTGVGLCFDTGHLLLGGGDPVTALRAWRPRINHVHLKDARRRVLDQVVAERAGMAAVWERGAFCEFGAGDVDVDGCLAALRETNFSGWLVVEQDRIPAPGEPLDLAAAAQRRNRAYLAARGL